MSGAGETPATASPGDRPRERLRALGPAALSDREVLALVLGGGGRGGAIGLAARVLAAVGGPAGLARAGERRLATIDGIGPARATGILAALELGRRCARALAAERPQFLRPDDAVALLAPRLVHLEREESVVLLLDRKHRLLREAVVGSGGVSHAPMEPREVFAAALREPGTAALIVAHNHPSGDPAPSPDDRAITTRLARGADLLGLELLDHLIVAAAGWRSLRADGVFA